MTAFADDVYLGPVAARGPRDPTAPSNNQGVGPVGRFYVFDIVPLTLALNNLAALQSTAGATPLVLAALAGVIVVVGGRGPLDIRYQFDVPRCVSLTSAGNLSAINFLVQGFDQYGQAMSQLLAGPNIGTVTTLKAFRQITAITPNAAATAVSAGSSDKFGFPLRCVDAGYACDPSWANVFARDTGTFTAADTTSPATPATGDVRGTYVPSSASSGAKRLVFTQALTALQVGPQATDVGAYGVLQA